MRKTKEVLRLRFEVGLGLRQIARSCSIGLGTVHEYLQRAEPFGSGIGKHCATDRAESADADIEMTRRKAFPAILRLRDRSYRKPIE